jgi:UDP-glucose 4-epimerase
MRVLVTGGAGFVGSYIVDRLIGRGDRVMVVDDMSTGKSSNLPRGALLSQLDIRDSGLRDVFSDFRPDVVAHCAAQAAVPVSVANPVLDAETNIVGGINVCQAAVSTGCTQFIYVTTGGALYGQPDYVPCDEDHPVRPQSPYGLSKWTLERYLGLLLPRSVRLKVLRLANVYGPRQDPEGEAGVVAIFAQNMLRGNPVTIFGDGEQTRDFIYVEDVARAYELAQLLSEPVTVNISSGSAATVNGLFRLMADGTGYRQPPVYEADRPGDIKHVVLANSRAKRLLAWDPETPLEEGLSQTIAWMKSRS